MLCSSMTKLSTFLIKKNPELNFFSFFRQARSTIDRGELLHHIRGTNDNSRSMFGGVLKFSLELLRFLYIYLDWPLFVLKSYLPYDFYFDSFLWTFEYLFSQIKQSTIFFFKMKLKIRLTYYSDFKSYVP